ncbi:hypothetical protein PUN28_003911 [Cardiocondyla obscurior]|uniref:Protein YIF1 n=1 Tax=Cardiocondyla obscurior TaxID=286306 RepID=A0AAW2GMT5_9HYME
MNYNHSNARRGKPKRLLDPSAGSPTPPMAQNPYVQSMYNQQMPLNNGSMSEYGFPMPPQGPPPYGYNPQMPSYPPSESQPTEFTSPQFSTQFLAQPVVTDMAIQYGNALVGTGKQHLAKYVPITALKYYFAVNTDYVFAKLMLLFFPFVHKDWSVKYEQDVPLQPRYETNAPDMYIPTMAFFTYIAVAGLVLGMQERFTPEHLGILATSALGWGLSEMLVFIASLYGLNLQSSLTALDLLAYCGYKYVGINTALLISLIFRKFGYYIMLLYFSASIGIFLMRSLKLRVIPQGHSYTASGNKQRLFYVLALAGIQPVLMWWLSYDLI